jgi:hypothetical protein
MWLKCRKGKLRCDHNSPVCGRCARRNKHRYASSLFFFGRLSCWCYEGSNVPKPLVTLCMPLRDWLFQWHYGFFDTPKLLIVPHVTFWIERRLSLEFFGKKTVLQLTILLKSEHNRLTHRSACVYHPAPLTKARASSSETPERLPSLPASSNRASPYPSRIQQTLAPISPSSLQEGSSASTRSMQQASPMLPMTLGTAHGRQMSSTISHKSPDNFTSSFRNNNGFLGPTAYSAVFTENSGKHSFVLSQGRISHSRCESI